MWFVFFLFLLKPSYCQERMTHSLEWTFFREGGSRKVYQLKYSGSESLNKLKRLQNKKEFLQNILPFLEASDRLISFRNPSPGVFTFEFRSSTHHPEPRDTLLFWLPNFSDPLYEPWESDRGSRYHFIAKDTLVIKKILVRAPWKILDSARNFDREISTDHMKAHFKLIPMSRSTDGNYEIQASTRVETEKGRLSRAEMAEMEHRFLKWTALRQSGIELVETDHGGIFEDRNYRFNPFWSFGMGYEKISYYSDFSHDGILFNTNIGLNRRFSRFLNWKPVETDIRTTLGFSGFSSFIFSLSTLPEVRIPFVSRSGPGLSLGFLDFFGGYGMHYLHLFQNEQNISRTGWTPGWKFGLRLGTATSFTHTSLTLQWTLHENFPGSSSFAVFLEGGL